MQEREKRFNLPLETNEAIEEQPEEEDDEVPMLIKELESQDRFEAM